MKITASLVSTVLLAMTISASPLQQYKRQDVVAIDGSDVTDDNLFADADPAPLSPIPASATSTVASVPTAAIFASVSASVVAEASSTVAASVADASATASPTDAAAAAKRSVTPSSCGSNPFTTIYTEDTPTSSSGTDTPDNFVAYQGFADKANDRFVPTGYTNVFRNKAGSVNAADWYSVKSLPTYNIQACADYCTSKSSRCKGFNLYYERDPLYDNPYNSGCPVPPGLTNVKCVLHSYLISEAAAKNVGQYRNGFKVVIAGSNGYVATNNPIIPTISGFQTGHFLDKHVINAPATQAPPLTPSGEPAIDTYMGSTVFKGQTDAKLCGTWCAAKTTGDRQGATDAQNNVSPYKQCNYFTSAVIYKNGALSGVGCAAYSYDWSSLETNPSSYNFGDSVNGITYDNALSYLVTGFTNTPAFRTEVPASYFQQG